MIPMLGYCGALIFSYVALAIKMDTMTLEKQVDVLCLRMFFLATYLTYNAQKLYA
jgi:hypothetical protein